MHKPDNSYRDNFQAGEEFVSTPEVALVAASLTGSLIHGEFAKLIIQRCYISAIAQLLSELFLSVVFYGLCYAFQTLIPYEKWTGTRYEKAIVPIRWVVIFSLFLLANVIICSLRQRGNYG